MIHQAQPADLERLADLASEFYSASKFLKHFDMDRFMEFWSVMIENESGVVFVLEDSERIAGTIGGVVYPDLYSGELICTEFFWFVTKAARGGGMQLYRAFEDWARTKHCTTIRMVHLADSMPERLSVVYKRLGFELCETHYQKAL
jgi:GNAT superfamily N-acetyltransferase